MPGIAALGKLFFEKNTGQKKRPSPCHDLLAAACARLLLIVGEIIRRKSRRWSKCLVTIDHSATMPAREEFVLVRVRRDDRYVAGVVLLHHVVREQWQREQVVDRAVEEALDLGVIPTIRARPEPTRRCDAEETVFFLPWEAD